MDNRLQVIPAIFEPDTQSISTSATLRIWSGNLKVMIQDTDLAKRIAINFEFIKMGAKWRVDGFTTEHSGLRTLYCEKVLVLFGSNDETQTLQLNLLTTVTTGGTLSVLANPVINYYSSDITIATVDSNGKVTFLNIGSVNITATLSLDQTTTSSIAITIVSEQQNNYTVQFVDSIGDSIANTATRTFVGNMKNNGVDVQNSQFDFEVIPGTTPTTKYAFSIVDDTSCTIKCLGNPYTITLRCYDRSNRLLYVVKSIGLKSII